MLNIGMIGAGLIAEHHEKAIADLDDCRIRAVCDVREEAAEAMAERRGAESFTDYKRLLDEDLEIVYICTPPYLHREMAVAAAEAGKHIFLEKPLALNYEDGLAIKEAVEKAGVKCQLGYVLGFNGAEDTARRLYREGELGELMHVWDRRMSNGTRSIIVEALGTYRDWLNDRERGGGVLIECMTHEVGWLLSVGGEVDSVYARIQDSPIPEVEVDDNAWATFNFSSGGVGVLGTSWSDPVGGGGKGIVGSEGALRVQGEEVLFAPQGGEKEKISGEDSEELAKQAYFNRCVREDLDPRNSVDKALYNLKVMLALHRSSEENRVVEI